MRKIVLAAGITLILISLLSVLTVLSGRRAAVTFSEGSADVSSTPYEQLDPAPLDGFWEFYPGRLYRPQDFAENPGLFAAEGTRLQVPGLWSTAEGMERTGYGTYRLEVKLPRPGIYALSLKSIYTSFRLFADDQLLLETGSVGTSRDEAVPKFLPTVATFTAEEDRTQLIFQVSNYAHTKGGLVQEIALGNPQRALRSFANQTGLSMYLSGVLFIMGLFMLTFYGSANRDVSILFFALFCLAISMRTTMGNTIALLQLFPGLPYAWEMRIEYLTISLGIIFFSNYSRSEFSSVISSKVNEVLTAVFLIYTMIILFGPIMMFTRMLSVMSAIIAAYGTYWLISMGAAWFSRRLSSAMPLLGGVVLTATVINDLFFYSPIEQLRPVIPLDLLPIGLFFFVLTHSFNFSFRYIEALRITRELTDELEGKVEQRTHELNELNTRLFELATTDELTGLGNRNELENRSEQEREDFGGGEFSVLYMDLDNFKYYNDTFSHEAGDQVLKEFAQLLRSLCEREITNPDAIFRMGGDEFVVLLPGCRRKDAEACADLVLTELRGLNEKLQSDLGSQIPAEKQITCSIGIASHTAGGLNIDRLIRLADRGLLEAKAKGKNQYIVVS